MNESKISKYWKSLKCCQKILKTAKAKVPNYEIGQNYHGMLSNFSLDIAQCCSVVKRERTNKKTKNPEAV
jgi:hypothetical protein